MSGDKNIGSNAEKRIAVLFLAPALLLLILFRLIPLGWGSGMSFTDANNAGTSNWVGSDNYVRAIEDPTFQASVVNTLVLLATMPVMVMLPMLLALLIHQGVPGGKFFRAVYFLPAVLSSIIVGAIFNVVLRYDGSLNEFLGSVGIDAVDWLGSSSTALGSLIVVQLWSTFTLNDRHPGGAL